MQIILLEKVANLGNLGDVVRRHAIRNPAHRSNPSSASKPDKEAT